MQRPARSTAGPPELPELIEALVCGERGEGWGVGRGAAKRARAPPLYPSSLLPSPHLHAQQLAPAVHVVRHLNAGHNSGHHGQAGAADGEADDGDRVLQARERAKLERLHALPEGGVLHRQ